MGEEPSRRRVTYLQLENLWEQLGKHRDIATGYNKTSQAREFSRRVWEEIALNLNSHGEGAVKDWKGWCKYWNDYKCKLKKLAAATRSSQNRTGGGQSTVKQMTDVEKKFLQLLGDDFGTGLPGIRVEPFEEVFNQVQNVNDTPQEVHSTPLSESILSGMDLVTYYEPEPSTSTPPNPTNRQPTSLLPPHPEHPQIVSMPLTPRRSPRRRLLTSGSPQSIRTPLHTSSLHPSPCRRLLLPPPPISPIIEIVSHDTQTTPTLTPAQHPDPISYIAPISTQPPPRSEHRRRSTREPPMTVEKARRALIAESQKQTKIQEAKLKLFETLIKEIREMKEVIQTRSNFGPARDGE